MAKMLQKDGATFYPLYCAWFLFAIHFAIPLYINSSFLGKFWGENFLGFIYIAPFLALLFILPRLPRVLSLFGNYKVALLAFGIEIALLVALSLSQSAIAATLLFITSQAMIFIGLFSLDVFLETFSEDTSTGTTRGIALTILNVAILIGPLLAGIILTNSDFWKVYLTAALFLAPALYIISRYLKDFKDPEYRAITFWKTLRGVLRATHPYDEIRHVIISDFLLRFFFTWMIVYTPLYLYKYIGFGWGDIGMILGIMLLPFIIFELPIGRFFDKTLQEKYIMAIGFGIAAFFTAILFFLEGTSVAVWAAVLFGTRIGASFIEIASESYFFKHIDKSDTNILSVYRNTQPLAYVLGPLCASALLLILPMKSLFLILALILIVGIWNSLLATGIQKTRAL